LDTGSDGSQRFTATTAILDTATVIPADSGFDPHPSTPSWTSSSTTRKHLAPQDNGLLSSPTPTDGSQNEQTPGGQLANIATNDFAIAHQTIDTNFHNLATKFEQLDVRVAATVPKLAEVDKNIEEINQDYAASYHARLEQNVEISALKQRCAKL
jgi:hypothetical protein